MTIPPAEDRMDRLSKRVEGGFRGLFGSVGLKTNDKA